MDKWFVDNVRWLLLLSSPENDNYRVKFSVNTQWNRNCTAHEQKRGHSSIAPAWRLWQNTKFTSSLIIKLLCEEQFHNRSDIAARVLPHSSGPDLFCTYDHACLGFNISVLFYLFYRDNQTAAQYMAYGSWTFKQLKEERHRSWNVRVAVAAITPCTRRTLSCKADRLPI